MSDEENAEPVPYRAVFEGDVPSDDELLDGYNFSDGDRIYQAESGWFVVQAGDETGPPRGFELVRAIVDQS